jgi:hypothetical protein
MKVKQIINVNGVWNCVGLSFPLLRTIYPNKVEPIDKREPDKKWFTNWNQQLLDKVLDYKRLNN